MLQDQPLASGAFVQLTWQSLSVPQTPWRPEATLEWFGKQGGGEGEPRKGAMVDTGVVSGLGALAWCHLEPEGPTPNPQH